MPISSTADYDDELWVEVPTAFPAPGYDSAEDWARQTARALVPAGATTDVYAAALDVALTEHEVAGRCFWFIAQGGLSGDVVVVSEPDRRLPAIDGFIQLSLEASEIPGRPADIRESVTSLGELLVSSTVFLLAESDGSPATAHRFVRLGTDPTGADSAVMASYSGGDGSLVHHIEALLAQVGRTEPVGIGWSAPTNEWDTLAARAGVATSPAAPPVTPAPLVFGRTDAQLAASVLRVSAHGDANAELTRIGLRDSLGRDPLRASLIMGAVAPPNNGRAILAGALSLLAIAVGFALVLTASDSAVTMALVGAVLIAAASVFLLVAELTSTVFAGTRTHMYGWPLFGALIVLVGWAGVRVFLIIDGSYGWWGNVRPAFILLIVSTLVLVAGLVAARRNRTATRAAEKIERAPERQLAAFAAEEAKLDAALRTDLARALRSRMAAQIDRGVAVATLRELVVSGRLSARRAEGILATIAG